MHKIFVSLISAALVLLVALTLIECASVKGDIQMDLGLPEKTYISPGIADGDPDRCVRDSTIAPRFVNCVALSPALDCRSLGANMPLGASGPKARCSEAGWR